MSYAPEDPDKPAPDDLLPDIEPPTSGFILKLFFIPGVIVMAMGLVVLLFGWLAHMGENPQSYMEGIRQNRANSWQLAHDLAIELRRNEKFQHDTALAQEVADYLDEALGEPLPKRTPGWAADTHVRDARSEEVERRGFLCVVLGRFHVDEGLPTLLRAAALRGDDDQARIQLAALTAISLLADNVADAGPLEHERLLPTLVTATRDERRIIQVAATYALGVIGSPGAIERLEQILDESHEADVHFNAATGLARNGNAACIDVLVEMLDPEGQRGLQDETTDAQRDEKRTRVMLGALAATRQLAEKNDADDLQPLVAAVEKLNKADVNAPVRLDARAVLTQLRERTLPGGKPR